VNHILAYASALNTDAYKLITAQMIKQGKKTISQFFRDEIMTAFFILSVLFWEFSKTASSHSRGIKTGKFSPVFIDFLRQSAILLTVVEKLTILKLSGFYVTTHNCSNK
jgi:glycerol uptake facilitator-like aquaporin